MLYFSSYQATQQKLLPSQLSYEASELKRHDDYVFWVTASTTVGEGEMSQSVHLKLSNKGNFNAVSSFVVIISGYYKI